ncbi:MAG: hypothetical protein IT454_12595 [Planctomycetes bacterium]|nr:hypothetical protein [Planctomycetota bacterium]
MTNANVAKKCFAENIRLFAHSETEPEKYNLYNGLAALADAMASIQVKLDDIDKRLRQLEVRR